MTLARVPIDDFEFDSKSCVAHFLVNHGTLACSGTPSRDGDSIILDVGGVDPILIERIDQSAGGFCVCSVSQKKWSFELLDLQVGQANGYYVLRAIMPPFITVIPTRQSERLDLPPHAVSLRLEGTDFSLLNLSEGGCAFLAPSSAVKGWPPGKVISGSVLCREAMMLDAMVSIVRIQYDISSTARADATVSCQFLSPDASAIIEALVHSPRTR